MRASRYLFANLTLAAWLLVDAYRHMILATLTAAGIMDTVFALILFFLALKVIVRKPPAAVATGVGPWSIVICATFLPTLYFWFPVPVYFNEIWAQVLRWIGTLGLAASAFKLGSNFSVIPHRRMIVTTGIYDVIRHPMYASYLILDLANWLPGGSPLAGVVWVAEACFLHYRALMEEKCLNSGNSQYAVYCQHVRYRYLPGVI